MICDQIKKLADHYEEKLLKDGLRYSNLFDYLSHKAKEGILGRPGSDDNGITEKEFREALKVLEDEDYISLIGHSSAPVIRFRS